MAPGLTPTEIEAIRCLQRIKDVVILTADKGDATVILDRRRSPRHRLSGYLHQVLSPLVGHIQTHILNSSAFVDRVRNIRLSHDDVMFPFDVVSFLTSVPVDLDVGILARKPCLNTPPSQAGRLLIHTGAVERVVPAVQHSSVRSYARASTCHPAEPSPVPNCACATWLPEDCHSLRYRRLVRPLALCCSHVLLFCPWSPLRLR
ncbi:hypothetical protein HPB49_026364 [Dermacentor silvarum]|nr:hypothetical protein HPB49_026364 [Dermacentor silvarum]